MRPMKCSSCTRSFIGILRMRQGAEWRENDVIYLLRTVYVVHHRPASFRFLSEQGWDVSDLKKKAKAICRQIVARTPGIGGVTGNSLHICLVAGMIWLSIYEAAEGVRHGLGIW